MDFALRLNDGLRWGIYMSDDMAALRLGSREIVLTWDRLDRATSRTLREYRLRRWTVAFERT